MQGLSGMYSVSVGIVMIISDVLSVTASVTQDAEATPNKYAAEPGEILYGRQNLTVGVTNESLVSH